MSVVRGFGLNGKSIYMNIAKPQVVECSFVVDSTAGAGLSSLKSNGYINAAYMHSSSASASNPNPANGILQVQFNNNFNKFLGLQGSVVSTSQTATKIDNSALTAGQVYVISTLGNATLAKWQAIGVPVGVTPAVGVAFIALTNGGAGNTLTSRVMIPKVSGISCIEAFGDSDLMVNSSIAANGGQYLFAQFLAPSVSAVTSALTMNSYTPAGTNDASTPPIFSGTPAVLTGTIVNSGGAASLVATAPADGSIVKLAFWFDGSSVTVDGL